jgi:hypothetical protein
MYIIDFINQHNPESIAEIGVLYGNISGRILENVISVKKLYMIDPWCEYINIGQKESKDKVLLSYSQDKWEDLYNRACTLANKFKDRTEVIRKVSYEASFLFMNNSLDMVIIDADHTYASVIVDIKSWIPKLKQGGILIGHDYQGAWPDVVQAVDELFGEKKVGGLDGSYWYAKKEDLLI